MPQGKGTYGKKIGRPSKKKASNKSVSRRLSGVKKTSKTPQKGGR